jgi:hypothetical protein
MEICGAGNRDEFIGSEMLRGPNISDADPSGPWNAASQFELKNAEGYVEKMPAELFARGTENRSAGNGVFGIPSRNG